MSLAAVAKPTRVSLDAVNSEFRQLAETVALSGEDNAQVATVVENNSEVKPEAEMGQVAGTPLTVRVLTFNIWLSGRRVENGLEKIAKHIRQINPDIVSLQEVETPDVMNNITEMLGHPWNAVWHGNRSYPDTAILTKHKFMLDQIVEVNWGNGAPVLVVKHGRSFVVNFFAMHLNYTSYGPYAAQNRMVTRKEQIYKGESSIEGRVDNIQELLDHPNFQAFAKEAEDSGRPLIVAGDFNCPSHQDWTEETKHLHGGWVFEWPATKMLTDIGMVDSYRELHPNVIEAPGHTWSTVQKSSGPEWEWSIPEPQDRLDFIFYKGSRWLKPIKSYTYAGTEPLTPIPNQWDNDYPSDHYAVLTDFKVIAE
ncbi:endonuclease/Exonuclease/phosphatase family domain-containing protein [Ditylenchus destructor]|uniref:Endonuclease/Exonuclease/phosphatase family domain-containing protein n=1 Tax=Ditylenchus destructor TaxID=166010 RepID=A0AAD4N9K8_9BILA|nr:endonuclease/Exonuclease/phosphatase family domain-containing protein [Ditylenchus destructor]